MCDEDRSFILGVHGVDDHVGVGGEGRRRIVDQQVHGHDLVTPALAVQN